MSNQLSANVNDTFDFSADAIQSVDAIADAPGSFHLLIDNRRVRADLLERDVRNKIYVFRINGARYRVQLADAYDRMVDQMGLAADTGQVANDITAPMPGLVLSVAVQDGQEVSKGDTLLILEAMKMENVIKAPADATIGKVVAQQGQAVEKGALLIELA